MAVSAQSWNLSLVNLLPTTFFALPFSVSWLLYGQSLFILTFDKIFLVISPRPKLLGKDFKFSDATSVSPIIFSLAALKNLPNSSFVLK